MTYEEIVADGLGSPARTAEPERAPLRVGVVQADWVPDARPQRARIAEGVRRAAALGAQLVCTQELTLSPYFAVSAEHARDGARHREAIPDGPTTDFAATLARETGAHVHASLYEAAEDGGLGYNTAICVAPDGRLLARTRKLHIPRFPGYREDLCFRPGDTGAPVVDALGTRLGFPTCWDQWFPELARRYSLAGAEVLVYPTAIGSEPGLDGFDDLLRVLVRLGPVRARRRPGAARPSRDPRRRPRPGPAARLARVRPARHPAPGGLRGADDPGSDRMRQHPTRREALLAGAAGLFGLAAAGCGSRGGAASTPAPETLAGKPIEDELLMGNWVDFTSPVNLKAFAAESGVKVTQAGYGSEEELIAKLRTGGFKFDLVVPGTGGLEQLRDGGLLMELDHDLLPNLQHLKPSFAGDGRLAPDPRFGVAKDYGIASFFWRTEVVDDPPRTIAEGFEMLARHRDARVNVIESSNELIALALAALGVSINSEDDADLARARDLLIAAKPSIDTISTQYIERGQRGDIDIGIGYSGDVRRIKQARAEAGDEIAFLIPEGPTEAFVDVWAIPANAPHPVAAHAWIDYVLDPRNAARETEHIQFGSPVAGVERHLPADLADDPITSIPDDVLARFEIPAVLSPEGERKRSRIFTEFKAA